MSELTVAAGPARDAVVHLIEHTPLIDGVLVHTPCGDDWSRLSLVHPLSDYTTGEALLWRLASSMVGHDELLSLRLLPLLEEPCRQAVLDALAILCAVDRAAEVWRPSKVDTGWDTPDF